MIIKTAKKFKSVLALLICISMILCTALAEPAAGDDNTGAAAETGNSEPDKTLPVIDGGPDIASASAVVMDINTGAVLYSKNPTEKQQPSSLTKLLTAYISLDRLSLGSTMSCSAGAASQDFPTAANVGYVSGEIFCVSDALKGMLLASAEDCAYALAEKCSGSMDSFAKLMNEYAEELGLLNSHFVNSMGIYVNNHYSCAYDMALVASKLMKNFPAYRGILSSGTAVLGATNMSSSREIQSSHRFMNGDDKCDYCYAAKTGGSAYGGDETWAMCCYAAHNNMDLACIIMGSPELDDAYDDTKALFAYAFNTFEGRPLSASSENSDNGIGLLFAEYPMFDPLGNNGIYLDKNATLIMPARGDEALLGSEIAFEQLSDFVQGENVIGKLKLRYGDRYAGSADIIYYTEETSMSEAEFYKLFPSFLTRPVNTYSSYIKPEVKNVTEKTSPLSRAKTSFLSLFTHAKLWTALFVILLFAAGTVFIFLVFPTQGGSKLGGLYTRQYEESENSDVDSETYDAKRIIKGDGDMTEIGADDMTEIK